MSDQTARPFCHGFEIQFEKAAMQFELSALTTGVNILPLTVMSQDGVATKPELDGADEVAAFAAEIDGAVKSITTNVVEQRLDGQIARDAIHICQCLQQSAEKGEWVACK